MRPISEHPMFAPVIVDGTELRPLYRLPRGTFGVQLWQPDGPASIYGMDACYCRAEDAVRATGLVLAELGIRPMTELEAARLYAGLVRAKGGPDWALLLLDIQDPVGWPPPRRRLPGWRVLVKLRRRRG